MGKSHAFVEKSGNGRENISILENCLNAVNRSITWYPSSQVCSFDCRHCFYSNFM